MRLVGDMIEWCTREMPRWHPVSISGYHIREAGSTAVQELAFTLKDGLDLRRAASSAGWTSTTSPPAVVLLQRPDRLLRGDRQVPRGPRIWARELRERFGAKNERSWLMRFHTQTAGVSLTAQQPEQHRPDRDRGARRRARRHPVAAHQLLRRGARAAHRGGGADRAAHPADHRHETGVTNTVDPLGGSYFVEALTDSMELGEIVHAFQDVFGKYRERSTY
jgi:methylmalonyl-CoA mutase, N-terminal domain